ncbi:HAMP domain-containing histidine kinase [Nocardioides sp. KIGAM211]|uniref:histidine kinase n=2 Tax=Nocardioides luti TaxID=2761101 RepID=A0A7X0V8M6_9ACTN|nr:HAMP domain-containing sensor histidine kinase [Nocardioides luti]MBB6625769.1 HAMP domain-containing histidine kinase [Nocardioides luti]
MLVLLSAAGAFVYWRVEYALDRGLDTELTQAGAVVAPLVAPSGRVTSTAAADATGTGWQVLDARGRVLDSGGTAPDTPLVPASDLAGVGPGGVTEDMGALLPVAAKPYRVRITPLAGGSRFLVLGVRRDHRDEALRELLLQLALAGLGALAVAALVGDLLARAALRPVETYRRRADEIAGGGERLRLDVPAGRDAEVTRLGHTLNDMLDALERSLEHERRFVNDASHELRTPLTLLSARLQLARRRTRTVAEHETTLDELAVDVARLTDLATQLLALGAPASGEPVGSDVARVVRDVVARRRATVPDGAPGTDLPAGDAPSSLAPQEVERIVTNLLDNAALHGAAPVLVRVRVVAPAWTVVEVRDGGPGMSGELLTTATGRFTRSAEARSRPGAGLGLALVDQLVRQADGELRLCSGGEHRTHGRAVPEVACEHGAATTVTVVLPQSGQE